uniref:DNA replication licensing factor MCM6 n=1 Tax=Alexandrium monilatum TaxID=311494 RepID=A0A7S4WED2_9DINO
MDPIVRNQLVQGAQRYFLEFLENFRQPNPDGGLETDLYYIEQAKTMIREGKRTLYVKVDHLEQIDNKTVSFEPADLRSVIETKYMMVRDALNAAVPQLLAKIEDPELQKEIEKVREKEELKFTAAFYNLPLYSGIRDMRAEKLGRLMTICGTITRMTEVKPELLVGTFECNECGREVSGVQQQFKVTMPAVCPARNCGNRTNWTLKPDSRTTRWGDWQRIRLQENENEVPAGSMPRSIDVIVRDECCDRCKPGDKVLITGSLIVVPDVPTMMSPAELKQQVRRSLKTRSDSAYGSTEGVRGLSGLGNRDLTYKLAFFGTFVDENSDWGSRGLGAGENVRSDDKVFLSQADKERFQQISDHVGSGGKRDCFDILARCIAPAIQGHLEVKKGILLMLIGGTPKRTDEGIKLRGDINVCILGDPATAKSALLKWTSTFLPRAVFASGKTSSAAGLTATVVKDADLENEKVIEPGALMLSDNGICCIDEFELMDKKDQVAIHEAMEQQTITLSKAGIQATLNARASILASCLPKNTYYQPTQPLHKNCDLSPPIMSRFDLMFVIQDIHDETNDNRVAEHILALHRRREEDLAQNLSQRDLQRYIRLARTFKPKITPEAHAKLVTCYKKLREDRTYTRGSSGVTVRQLESLIRLSEAISRVYLDDKVRVEYVIEAFELQWNSLRRTEKENIDLNPEVGEDEPLPEAERPAADDLAAAAARRRQRKMKITFDEYQRVGQMLAKYLAQQEQLGVEVTEEDLWAWYMESVEDQIQTEAQLAEHHYQVELIINRLIDKDRVIVVARTSEDPTRPERRTLVKHPNFPIGEIIAAAPAERGGRR